MGIMYKLMKHRNSIMDLNKTSTKSERNRLITIEGNIIEEPLSTSRESADAAAAADDLTNDVDSNMDKQFTAEHIIQLCKFLAEKSKRNKNLYKQQQSPKKITKNKQSQFLFQPMEYHDNDDDEMEYYQNEALPLLSQQRVKLQQKTYTEDDNNKYYEFEQQKTSAVLSMRLSPDINSLNISLNTTTASTCAQQHHHQQQQEQQQQDHQQQLLIYNYQQQQQPTQPQPPQIQGKRDILLKIRRQIFERKRLRENGAFEPQPLNNSQVWRPW